MAWVCASASSQPGNENNLAPSTVALAFGSFREAAERDAPFKTAATTRLWSDGASFFLSPFWDSELARSTCSERGNEGHPSGPSTQTTLTQRGQTPGPHSTQLRVGVGLTDGVKSGTGSWARLG